MDNLMAGSAVPAADTADALDKSVTYFMAEPVTPRSTILEGKDDIKVRMELFIMKIQVMIQFL